MSIKIAILISILLLLCNSCSAAPKWDHNGVNQSALSTERPIIINYNASWGYDIANRTPESIDTAELYYGFNANGSLLPSDLFNVTGLLKIYKINNILPNGIILRNGSYLNLTEDKNLAGHAGNSTMPLPDGRKGVNHFAFGWRTISLNATFANAVANITGEDPNKYAPTEEQYRTIAWLLASKNISNLVYYNEIKPPGKFPTPNIDTEKIKEALRIYNLTIRGYNITNIQ